MKQYKKVEKGVPGYLDAQKKIEMMKAAAAFALVLAVLILGIIETGTRLNLLTLVAVLGCLPASKILVGVITRYPHHSIDPKKAAEIEAKAEHLTTAYDMVVTSREKIMPIDAVVISDNTICGCTGSKKVDTGYASEHIKSILRQNHYDKVSVKIFADYTAFISRVEGMNSIAAVERKETKEKEERLKRLILNISL